EVLWLADRARSEVVEADDADGRAAVQDPGAGPQGDLGPRLGLQPGPHGDGTGRCEARRRAAVGQLQGGRPDPPGVPAGARGTRGTEPGPLPGGVRAGPRGGRGPPVEGPAGPVRAAATEAAAETLRLPAAAEGRGQASDAQRSWLGDELR